LSILIKLDISSFSSRAASGEGFSNGVDDVEVSIEFHTGLGLAFSLPLFPFPMVHEKELCDLVRLLWCVEWINNW